MVRVAKYLSVKHSNQCCVPEGNNQYELEDNENSTEIRVVKYSTFHGRYYVFN